MSRKSLYFFALFLLVSAIANSADAGTKKVVIHVPYHVKNIKHTHTIYKIIKHQHEHKPDHEDFKKELTSGDFNDHFYKKK